MSSSRVLTPVARTVQPAGKQRASAAAAERVPRIPFGLVAVLGYAAFLISGFGTGLGSWRPIPLYLFAGVLMFLFQLGLTQTRTRGRLLYTGFATVFALAYAADVVFNTSGGFHFTRAPLTYVLINMLLIAVLVADAVRRRDGQHHPFAPATLATDFAELAILSYVAATLANLLGAGAPPYVLINLNQAFGLHLPERIASLQDLDSAIALAATALALLFLGIVAGASSRADGHGAQEETRFLDVLLAIGRTTLREVTATLRLVLGPLVFVSAGLSAAYLSLQITGFFASAQQSSHVFDLLNPFGPASRARYEQGLVTLLLTGVTVLMVVLSVALVEQNLPTIWRSLRAMAGGAEATALSLGFFIFSLAFLNAVLIFIGVTKVEPFQVSAFALLALAIGGGVAAASGARGGGDQGRPVA